ncbi:glycosyltransferase [Aliarcobacter skirrowii]|uniref:Glycosyltransferase n=1 Tax=Aliarcobacter skirrowii TaxID=28200 RepID=A0A2U2C0S9_9BACT|nr:glycosyltransferase family 2 protein [Aliarcobacter skirrowii]PWE21613.1 glycosyltransferase [Aliarcobacter skirrowii]
MRISIITVVYNGEKYLENTILSVINQTYHNVEYIIIDGGSTDGTIDIIKRYEDKIYCWISERDKGIYDAMNKGIELASGEWINFMNAGDVFFDTNVLNSIFLKKDFKDIDVVYGNHNVIYKNKTRIKKAGNIKNIWKGSQFCHQSTFVSAKVHKANKFNLSNRIGADFELFYTLYKKKMTFKYVNVIVANYSAGGLSDIKRLDSIIGRWNIIEKNTKVNFYYIWIILKEILKNYIKKFIR